MKRLTGIAIAAVTGTALHFLVTGTGAGWWKTALAFSLTWLFFFQLPLSGILHLGSRSAWYHSDRFRVLRRFVDNRSALTGCLLIVYAVLVFVFAHLIAPDPSPYAAQQVNELAFSPPGTRAVLFKRPLPDRGQDRQGVLNTLVSGRATEYRLLAVTDAKVDSDGVEILRYYGEGLSGRSTFYTWKDLGVEGLQSNEAREQWLDDHLEKRLFLLGTDDLGRDYLSRVLVGTRVSLAVGAIAVLIALLIGIPVGAAAGFYKKQPPVFSLGKRKFKLPADGIIMWIMSVVWAIPTLLLVFPIVFAFGQQYYTIFIAVGVTMWVDIARITRGQVMQEREKEYVEATRSFGFSRFRAIIRHILPNITGPLIVVTAANFAYAILTEAGLSFLGIGVQPPAPSWGLMISRYKDNLITDPHLALVPGFAITLLVLAFFLVGNGLRDAFDHRSVNQ